MGYQEIKATYVALHYVDDSRMDPLKYIFESLHVADRASKWQVILSEYDIKYQTQKSIKGSTIADHLAKNPLDRHEQLNFQFPDENICFTKEDQDEEGRTIQWEMYFDEAANIHGNGVGAIMVSPSEKQFSMAIKLGFKCTNNMAEYEACINGLRATIDLSIKSLEVFGDSALIIYQVTGEW
ncbi:uncharacterized protein LOC129286246 [Prosopis cineraria]|uniref:uncharacterized protein LOC129286246 n=1 Tax=Prosopis cineraria TaxID=364024 RepID=UPI0024100818|nr:uncharacterized protein LOC129286246 [Prosopis cineraria]